MWLYLSIIIFHFIDPIHSQEKYLDSQKLRDDDFPVSINQIQQCSESNCKLPDCKCFDSTDAVLGLDILQTPQIVMISFDDSVTSPNNDQYKLLLDGRLNPNDCPISTTFFVSHEYTNYQMVEEWYTKGHEIASHSISHRVPQTWWANASYEDWIEEIAGQKEILIDLANIPRDKIVGSRAPFLQIGGDVYFRMLTDYGFNWDSSITSKVKTPPIWPFTVDYQITERCNIPPCPQASYPGMWEVPLVHYTDKNGFGCAMVDACYPPDNEEEAYELLNANFERHYHSNRAPFPMFFHPMWFYIPHYRNGLKRFLDKLDENKDVYIVSISKAIEWIKNPTPLPKIKNFDAWTCKKSQDGNIEMVKPSCLENQSNVCTYFTEYGYRYVRTCSNCPKVYPWYGNPYGELSFVTTTYTSNTINQNTKAQKINRISNTYDSGLTYDVNDNTPKPKYYKSPTQINSFVIEKKKFQMVKNKNVSNLNRINNIGNLLIKNRYDREKTPISVKRSDNSAKSFLNKLDRIKTDIKAGLNDHKFEMGGGRGFKHANLVKAESDMAERYDSSDNLTNDENNHLLNKLVSPRLKDFIQIHKLNQQKALFDYDDRKVISDMMTYKTVSHRMKPVNKVLHKSFDRGFEFSSNLQNSHNYEELNFKQNNQPKGYAKLQSNFANIFKIIDETTKMYVIATTSKYEDITSYIKSNISHGNNKNVHHYKDNLKGFKIDVSNQKKPTFGPLLPHTNLLSSNTYGNRKFFEDILQRQQKFSHTKNTHVAQLQEYTTQIPDKSVITLSLGDKIYTTNYKFKRRTRLTNLDYLPLEARMDSVTSIKLNNRDLKNKSDMSENLQYTKITKANLKSQREDIDDEEIINLSNGKNLYLASAHQDIHDTFNIDQDKRDNTRARYMELFHLNTKNKFHINDPNGSLYKRGMKSNGLLRESLSKDKFFNKHRTLDDYDKNIFNIRLPPLWRQYMKKFTSTKNTTEFTSAKIKSSKSSYYKGKESNILKINNYLTAHREKKYKFPKEKIRTSIKILPNRDPQILTSNNIYNAGYIDNDIALRNVKSFKISTSDNLKLSMIGNKDTPKYLTTIKPEFAKDKVISDNKIIANLKAKYAKQFEKYFKPLLNISALKLSLKNDKIDRYKFKKQPKYFKKKLSNKNVISNYNNFYSLKNSKPSRSSIVQYNSPKKYIHKSNSYKRFKRDKKSKEIEESPKEIKVVSKLILYDNSSNIRDYRRAWFSQAFPKNFNSFWKNYSIPKFNDINYYYIPYIKKHLKNN
ncbi:unnamed protein product [Gordionus sp. m RMFG-2023]